MFRDLPINTFVRDQFYLSSANQLAFDDTANVSSSDDSKRGKSVAAVVESPRAATTALSSPASADVSRKESLQLLVDKLCDPRATSVVTGARFMELTKKMRQQIMSKLLSRLRNQLVVYNVKALFRIYMIFHRDDRLIHTICDLFSKQRVYDVKRLRREILAKNTKPYPRKVMRNKLCNDVMHNNPNMLRLFDNRMLNYIDKTLREAHQSLHSVLTNLPVIVCMNERDVDHMIEQCRAAYSRQRDFPLRLLPHSMRLPFSRLFDMRR